MRNDVKLGFAIGGVLLAVLIVYVLVVPNGSNANKQAKVDSTAQKNDAGKVTLESVPATQAAVPPAPPAAYTPGVSPLEPAKPPVEVASNDAADKPVDPAPPAKAKDIDWNKLLNGQALMTETPVSGGAAHAQPEASQPKVSPPPLEPDQPKYAATIPPSASSADSIPGPAALDQTPMDQPDKAALEPVSNPPSHSSLAAPSTQPAGAVAGRTHIVQPNETFSSISAAAYGSPNYWPAIVKANPKLDPNRMRVGTTVILPDLKDIKTGPAQTASAKIAGSSPVAAINPQKQYRVVPGDSMYKISVKLYGNSSMSTKIYDANKPMIGDDPARLKVGQVLQLPEPPTIAAVH